MASILRIPNIVKHTAIAIYREGKVSSRSRKDKFIQALKIAKARLAQYGFIVLSGDKPDDPIALTAKGRVREMHHKTEGRSKSVLFDTLFEKFDLDGSRAAAEKALEEKAQKAAAAERERARAQRGVKK